MVGDASESAQSMVGDRRRSVHGGWQRQPDLRSVHSRENDVVDGDGIQVVVSPVAEHTDLGTEDGSRQRTYTYMFVKLSIPIA